MSKSGFTAFSSSYPLRALENGFDSAQARLSQLLQAEDETRGESVNISAVWSDVSFVSPRTLIPRVMAFKYVGTHVTIMGRMSPVRDSEARR